jgi:hypothetical protein
MMKSGRVTNTPEASAKPERLTLFDHLPNKQPLRNPDLVEGDRILHPATLKLGALYSQGIIQTDDDRVTSMVAVFCNIIKDYKTPPKKVLREDLDKHISKQVDLFAHTLSYTISCSGGTHSKFLVIFLCLWLGSVSGRVSRVESGHGQFDQIHAVQCEQDQSRLFGSRGQEHST